jgi:cardiolipin synthase (CMP-forming)
MPLGRYNSSEKARPLQAGLTDDGIMAVPGRGVGRRAEPGRVLSIPNLISLGRIILVPIVVWAITSGEMLAAFCLFLTAGISDAVDGFLAKHFRMASELGAYLDPLADKALIVSVYVALGISRALPIWLVILVVSRDIMIISGFMLAWLVDKPIPVRPHPVSKLNTVMQILLATLVLAEKGIGFDAARLEISFVVLAAVLTLLSIGFYLAEWFRHMNSIGVGH